MNIDEAIDLAIANSTEVQIETKKTELSSVSRFDAATMFLPSVNYNYRDGERKTEINNSNSDKKDDKTRTLNFSQPLFTGFSGVSKVAESNYQTKSAHLDLNFKKNQIATKTVEAYSNIVKYRQIQIIDQDLIKDYEKLVALASQRLSLKDIDFEEFSNYELKSRQAKVSSNEDKVALSEYEAQFFNLTNSKSDNLENLEVVYQDYKLEDLIVQAENQNPKIKSTALNYKAKKAAVAAESGRLLPKVTFNMSYEDQKSSYLLNDQSYKNRSVYLNISVPIFQSGVEYSYIIKANKERQIANLEKKLTQEQIEKEINVQHQKYLVLKEDLASLKKSLDIDYKALELAKQRFDKRDIGMMEYLIKKISAAQTHRHLIITNSDLIVTHYNLKSLINEIINYNQN